MKQITQYLMLIMLLLVPMSLASCSDDGDNKDKDPVTSSLIGTWEQTNSYGTVIDITFNRGGTGDVTYKYETGSISTEYFEYTTKVDSDNNQYVYISSDDCQLAGDYIVKITPNTLELEGYANGEYGTYRFKRIK